MVWSSHYVHVNIAQTSLVFGVLIGKGILAEFNNVTLHIYIYIYKVLFLVLNMDANLFSCFLSLCVVTLCDRFLSWWCPIFGDSLDLWCNFFALVIGILWICGVASLLWRVAGSLVPLWQFDQRQFWIFCICLDSSTWIGNKNFLLFIICERELFEYIGVLGYVRVPLHQWNSPSSPLNVGQKLNHVNPWCLLSRGAFAQHI